MFYTNLIEKVAGYNRISNEMLSCLLNTSQEIIKKLFNAILRNPKVLTTWNISLISPIYKKGSKTKPENYRGISLLPCIGKFFTSILNQRLLIFVSEMRILSKSQLGFVPGNRTPDALITLHIVINYYCKKFTLFQKPLDHNINGKFYNCLIYLYTNDKSHVKVGNRITDHLIRTQGVKQGCILIIWADDILLYYLNHIKG